MCYIFQPPPAFVPAPINYYFSYHFPNPLLFPPPPLVYSVLKSNIYDCDPNYVKTVVVVGSCCTFKSQVLVPTNLLVFVDSKLSMLAYLRFAGLFIIQIVNLVIILLGKIHCHTEAARLKFQLPKATAITCHIFRLSLFSF